MPRKKRKELKSGESPIPPCIEMTPSSKAPEITETNSTLLEWIHPMSHGEFMQAVFLKQALAVHGGGEARIEALCRESLGGLNVPHLLETSASESTFVWVAPKKGVPRRSLPPGVAPRPLKSVEVEDPASAATLHTAGMSMVCRAPPKLEASLVGGLLRSTGLGLGALLPLAGHTETGHDLARGEVEMFYTASGNLTDWHFDFQENFTIQLSGAKRWRFARSPVSHPTRGHQPHYDSAPDVVERQLKAARLCPGAASNFPFAPPASLLASNNSACSGSGGGGGGGSTSNGANPVEPAVQEVVLRAGDVLYFPSGMWHSVECLEEGVSLNVSLMAHSWADLTSAAVKHALSTLPLSRTALCPVPPPSHGHLRRQQQRQQPGGHSSNRKEGDSKAKETEQRKKSAGAAASGGKCSGGKRESTALGGGGGGVAGEANADACRAVAAAVLAELRSVAERLTVDDLLPLVLSHGPPPQHGDDVAAAAAAACTQEPENGGSDDGDADCGDGHEKKTHNKEEDEGAESDVLNVGSFELPNDLRALWGRSSVGDQSDEEFKLRANPLAEVVEEAELTAYYRKQRILRGKREKGEAGQKASSGRKESSSASSDLASERVWIVHVNFGNEGLQSAVRARLRCKGNLDVRGLWALLRETRKQKVGDGATAHADEDRRSKGEGAPMEEPRSVSVQSECDRHRLVGGPSTPSTSEIRKLLGALTYYGALSPLRP